MVKLGETVDATSNYKSNTGFRFVTKSPDGFKISIPKPEGGYIYKRVGHKKVGEEQALRKAIMLRNKVGKELWNKFWHRVVSDWTLLARLPRSLEPVHRVATDRKNLHTEYVANWIERTSCQNKVRKTRRYSCQAHTKLGAYTKAKQQLLSAHKENMELLIFMGRAPTIKLV